MGPQGAHPHPASGGPYIRAASLEGFGDLVREFGGDPLALTADHGIAAMAIEEGEGQVPITMHDLMLDAAARQLQVPDLGLRLAERQSLTMLGPLAAVIETSQTAAVALEAATRYMFVHSPALHLNLEPDPLREGGVLVVFRKDLTESSYSPQAMELGLGVTYRLAAQLLGQIRGLRGIDIPHAPMSPVARYTSFFGAPVRFGAATGGLRIDASLLDVAFETADADRRQQAIAALAQQRDPNQQTGSRVRRAIAQCLGDRPVTLPQIAELFAEHPRTVQRRLEEEGHSFEEILDSVRREAVARYLTLTDLPLAQITTMAGFAEQSSLSRAVRRWYGVSPRQVRQEYLARQMSS